MPLLMPLLLAPVLLLLLLLLLLLTLLLAPVALLLLLLLFVPALLLLLLLLFVPELLLLLMLLMLLLLLRLLCLLVFESKTRERHQKRATQGPDGEMPVCMCVRESQTMHVYMLVHHCRDSWPKMQCKCMIGKPYMWVTSLCAGA
jgi:membrane protein implicated in regulation of membrane protease activity